MPSPFQRIRVGFGVLAVICLVAVGGYVTAGWSPMDALYFVVITIFGVGYGEVQPVQSPQLRMFTILVIVSGSAASIYTVGGFIQMLTEGEIKRALGARRITMGIEKLEGHTLICGYGRIGRILAAELHGAQKPFVVLDIDLEKIREAEAAGFLVVQGDAASDSILLKAGIMRARALATVLPNDAANVFITLTASELNPGLEIIARAEDPATERKLLRSGATRVVLPAAIGAVRIAHLLVRSSAESLLEEAGTRASLNEELNQIGLQFDELRIPKGSPLDGHTLADIEVKGHRGFLIVALRKVGGEMLLNPGGDTPLAADDTVIVVGHRDDLPKLVQRYTLKREIQYRGTRGTTISV